MSFVSQFHTISLQITDSGRQVYEKLRIRVAQHPEESGEYPFGRIFAYAHSWTPSLQFTQGLFDEKEPTIEARNEIDELSQWIQVGLCERKKLERTLKSSPKCKHRMYFLSRDEVHRFCFFLKGSKTNWVERVEFFLFDSKFLLEVASLGVMLDN